MSRIREVLELAHEALYPGVPIGDGCGICDAFFLETETVRLQAALAEAEREKVEWQGQWWNVAAERDALRQRVEALERAVKWLDEFVVEPEWFPNEGDRQYWQEKRAALRGGGMG